VGGQTRTEGGLAVAPPEGGQGDVAEHARNWRHTGNARIVGYGLSKGPRWFPPDYFLNTGQASGEFVT
jgi:hypothetical protein